MNPFDLNDDPAYQAWREQKLDSYPATLDELVVEINDPRQLSRAEYEAMLQCCQQANMVIYAGKVMGEDKQIPRLLGERFGLTRLNHNWLADEDAITSLTVNPEGHHPDFIPYTNRAIRWHTDGYYNPLHEQVHGLLLHCVNPAEQGGENQLLDHEMLYIQLRDENPAYIEALMQPDAMTIPPRLEGQQVVRQAQPGPVFSVSPQTGHLHMRYTARTRSIEWKAGSVLSQAVRRMEQLLGADNPYCFSGRLEAGMGLVSNNVLHDRSAFSDKEGQPRLLYRARYFDRIAHTDLNQVA